MHIMCASLHRDFNYLWRTAFDQKSGILLHQGVPVEQNFGFLLWSGNLFPLLLLLLVKQEFPVEGGDGGVRHWGEGGLHDAPHLNRV